MYIIHPCYQCYIKNGCVSSVQLLFSEPGISGSLHQFPYAGALVAYWCLFPLPYRLMLTLSAPSLIKNNISLLVC